MSEQNPKAPASDTTPELSALDRMRELTRRIVRVPKAELPKAEKKPPIIAGKRRG